MKKISSKTIVSLIRGPSKIHGELNELDLIPRPISTSEQNSFSFIDKNRADKVTLLNNSRAYLILCPLNISIDQDILKNRLIIEVEEPKLEFARIVNYLYKDEINNFKKHGIDASAIIHSEAKISSNSYIGPHTYIGQSSIGDNCIIHGNVHIYDNVTIGANVVIHAGAIIGAEGFGFIRNADEILNFPHIGGIIIENNVEIGANTCIDRGALGNTFIGKNVKIDNLVHIGHNVHIEEGVMIAASATISGSCHINKNCYLSPSATMDDSLSMGEGSLLGIGAITTKAIPENESWMGNPAYKLKQYAKIQKKLRSLYS